MRVLAITHPIFAAHDAGSGHPERPTRLAAALEGIHNAPVDLVEDDAPEASRRSLVRVHTGAYIDGIRRFCRDGGGKLDPDTGAVEASWAAATRAAGAGPHAVRQMEARIADLAFAVVRPPGHHARPATAMGFCLFNNVAVTTAMLLERGERVAIVDWDVHHGNGTEEMFRRESGVLYISMHQYPFYPGTGAMASMTADPADRTTLNLPLPAGAAGDLYRQAFDGLILPVLEGFRPDWLLVSAGYDAHADDPLASLRLLPSDYAYMASALSDLMPSGRTVYFLEGGYDLKAITDSVTATLAGAAGQPVPAEARRYRSPERAYTTLRQVRAEAAKVWKIGDA